MYEQSWLQEINHRLWDGLENQNKNTVKLAQFYGDEK
jgi:hypothetical protein